MHISPSYLIDFARCEYKQITKWISIKTINRPAHFLSFRFHLFCVSRSASSFKFDKTKQSSAGKNQ